MLDKKCGVRCPASMEQPGSPCYSKLVSLRSYRATDSMGAL